jgi:hypothetical protein
LVGLLLVLLLVLLLLPAKMLPLCRQSCGGACRGKVALSSRLLFLPTEPMSSTEERRCGRPRRTCGCGPAQRLGAVGSVARRTVSSLASSRAI